MNTKDIIILATLCPAFCFGQSNVVFYGANSNALDVVFVDTNLSQKAKSAIVADLRICLQEWGKKGEVHLWNRDGIAGYFRVGTICPHYPEGIDFPKNIVSNGTAGVALQISKELSDAYTNAFVEFVNSPGFLNLPPKDLPNYLLRSDTPPKEIIADAKAHIADLRHQTYYPPSVLGFLNSETGPARKNLWMQMPSKSTREWGYFPAIWHQGRWKFCIWQEKEKE